MFKTFLIVYPSCAIFIAIAAGYELRDARRLRKLCERIRSAMEVRNV
jgi:hypothetical protein